MQYDYAVLTIVTVFLIALTHTPLKSFESSQILDLVSNGHIVNQIVLQENDYKVSIFGVVVIGVIAALIAGGLMMEIIQRKKRKKT
ncbi:MAG: hypothetical protein WDZ43_06600 [Nitrosopumilaceae archaeon]